LGWYYHHLKEVTIKITPLELSFKYANVIVYISFTQFVFRRRRISAGAPAVCGRRRRGDKVVRRHHLPPARQNLGAPTMFSSPIAIFLVVLVVSCVERTMQHLVAPYHSPEKAQ
jgi:hypothetical protein